MPLIVLTGIPCSGKSKRALELKEYFERRNKEVSLISEENEIKKAGLDKNSVYKDSIKEKHIRGILKSEVLKQITQHNVVVLDGLNYIKGYRYELFCGTKSNKCSQCTIHTEINREVAWDFNSKRSNETDKYDREIFDALVMRYEEPVSKNRWDSPLFMIFPDGVLDHDAIYSSLFDKTPPKPNMSTQNPPLTSTNFLYDVDKVTKQITDGIIKMKNMGMTGRVNVPGFEGLSVDITNKSIQQLIILRRQYLTYSKMHAPNPEQVPQLFTQYLESTLQ